MGPETDLIKQVKKALHQVRAPVYYDGQKHDAEYPQVIIDLSNIQNEPRSYKGVEGTKLTISVDVYSKLDRLDILLDISNQVRNIMQQVKCAHWQSKFDDYSGRILDDESYQGQSLKRTAFLFDFIVYAILRKEVD